MATISDILNYDKQIKVTNTTNFVKDTLIKLEKLKFVLKSIEDNKINVILYSLLKLDYVWFSQFEKYKLTKHQIRTFKEKLIILDFIEKYEPTQSQAEEIVENMEVKPCDFNKMIFYKLTNNGFKFISNNEILDSLNLLVNEKIKNDIINIRYMRSKYDL